MKVVLKAEREIAFDSPDHKMPWGTRTSNRTNQRFNQKLWRVYPQEQVVKVLDLGCAGAAFVRSCIDDGHFAVGLDGSDFSRKHKRAAWALIPDFLFTCDITRPFSIVLDDDGREEPLKFDVITAWEFIEHITEDALPMVAHNVHSHLAPGGLFFLSVANHEDIVGGVRLHQTVRPRAWWLHTFRQLKFEPQPDLVRFFSRQFVAGARVDNDRSFHFILTNDESKAPNVPATSVAGRLYDFWLGSSPQRLLRKLIGD